MKKQTRAPPNAKYFMRPTNAALPADLTVPAKIPILPASFTARGVHFSTSISTQSNLNFHPPKR
jgi:hypothetical protein